MSADSSSSTSQGSVNTESQQSPSVDSRPLGLAILLVALTFAVYFGIFSQDFVQWDDNEYVTQNPKVLQGLTWDGIWWAFTQPTAANYHPFTWLSLMLDVNLFGRAAWGFKLTNVAIHAANAVLVFLLFYRMTGSIWPSFFLAAFFALHPLRVESVAWVSERKDVLSTFFALLTMYAYVWMVGGGGTLAFVAMFFAYFASLLAKQMYVTLPAVLLLLDYWPLGRLKIGSIYAGKPDTPRVNLFWAIVEKLPLLAAAIPFSIIIYQIQVITPYIQRQELSPGGRFDTFLVATVAYLRKNILPVDLAFFYPFPTEWYPPAMVAGCGALLLAITIVSILLYRKAPHLIVGWLWCIGTLLPVIGFVRIGFQAYADRYTYFPFIGFLVMIVWSLAALVRIRPQERAAIIAVSTIALVGYMGATYYQVTTWNDTKAMTRHALAVTDENFVAHNQLGTVLLMDGDFEEAVEELRAAAEINPNYWPTQLNLGPAELGVGRVKAAKEAFKRSIQLNPNAWNPYYQLGLISYGEGEFDEAITYIAKAIYTRQTVSKAPVSAQVVFALGLAYGASGRYEEAQKHLQSLLQLGESANKTPQLAQLLHMAKDASELLKGMQQGDPTAENRFRLRYRWTPNSEGSRMLTQLAIREATNGDLDGAIETLHEALDYWPNNVGALYNLGGLLCQTGSVQEGMGYFQRVLEIEPDNELALKAVGKVKESTNTPVPSNPAGGSLPLTDELLPEVDPLNPGF